MEKLRYGFMQGRMTNKGGFYPQQFPWNGWKEEFFLGYKEGFSCIEWMFNSERWNENPIVTKTGIEEITQCMEKSKLRVSSICANYFMQHDILCRGKDEIGFSSQILKGLCISANKISCKKIVIPLFEDSKINFQNSEELEQLKNFLLQLESKEITFCLETDENSEDVERFISYVNNETGRKLVAFCYDIGNATGIGRNAILECKNHMNIIYNIHIKDKKIGGNTCLLGSGDVDFIGWCQMIKESQYDGDIIFESYYGEDAIADTIYNFKYIKEMLGEIL